MALVSVTRLHLRSRWFFLPFVICTLRSGQQAKRSSGFRGGVLGNDAAGGNWTITVWDTEGAMRAFRNTGVHRSASRCGRAERVYFFVTVHVPPAISASCPLARSDHVPFAEPPSKVAPTMTSDDPSRGKPYFALIFFPSKDTDLRSAV